MLTIKGVKAIYIYRIYWDIVILLGRNGNVGSIPIARSSFNGAQTVYFRASIFFPARWQAAK